MFGYVKPFKPQLRICEYEAYKALYCGLCGQLGRSFGMAARLTLSYDFTFLAALHCALREDEPEFEKHRCYVNPLKKCTVCRSGEPLSFAADTAVIMIYYKLLDNIHDSRGIPRLGWRCLSPVVRRQWGKASERRPGCDEVIRLSVGRQGELEAAHTPSPDAASDPSAHAMASILAALSGDEREKRVLERIGYCVGRFVYLCDALDDLEDDVRKKNYNPFALRYEIVPDSPAAERDKAYEVARESIYATIAEAAKAYELLDVKRFAPILDNIFYLGMRASADEILAKKEQSQ